MRTIKNSSSLVRPPNSHIAVMELGVSERKSDVSELGVSSICTCNYLYVHVCKGYNESKIVLNYNQVIKY